MKKPALQSPSSEKREPAKLGVATSQVQTPASEKDIERIRSEAKMNLMSAYAAQKAFRAEHERYTTDLWALGIAQESSVLGFKLGFLERSYPESLAKISETMTEDPRRFDTDSFIGEPVEKSELTYSYAAGVEEINLEQYRSLCRQGCTADHENFEMLLAVALSPGRIDVWRINNHKALELAYDGVKQRAVFEEGPGRVSN